MHSNCSNLYNRLYDLSGDVQDEKRTENITARLHGPSQAQTEELSVDESKLHYMSQRRFTSSTARREMPTTR